MIAVTAIAPIVGDTLGYAVGRRGGRRFLLRDGFGAAHRRQAVARADRFFARNGMLTVFLGRFLPGVRVVAALMAGATRMPWLRFAAANAAGAVLWATVIGIFANTLGAGGSVLLAGAGLALGAVALTTAWWRARRQTRRLLSACAARSRSVPV